MKGLSLQPLHEFEKRIAKEKEKGRLKNSNDHLKGQKKIPAVKHQCRSLMVYALPRLFGFVSPLQTTFSRSSSLYSY